MNVPKLRFKEFNDEWIETKIQNVATVIGGGTPSTDEPKYWGNEINWFTPSEIGKTKYVTISNRKISQDGLKNSSAKLLPKGTILLSSRATVGEASILLNEASTNQGFQSLIVNENNCNEFIYYLKYKYKREMLIKSFGSTFLEISKSNVENIKIKIPSKEEQLKVANFLSLLDKKIELQSKKIEDLKLFKKGLINNELNCLNNCQSVSLNDLGITYSGLSGKTKEDFENGNCKFINFMSVLKDNIDISSLTTVKINPNEKQNKVEKGDLFFMTSSETKEEVALCSTLSYDVKNLYLNSFCFGYRINDLNVINNEYLNCLLHSPKYRKQISNLGQGFTRVNISKNKLLELLIEVPDMKQQLRIVSINNKLNCKINLENEKLNKLSELKKGLMQKMFV